jgi:glycosyltransferase involved in cell wall biosynthesis
MSGRLNILHVAQPCDGGVARYLVAACLDQVARGWDVAVACPDGGRLAADLIRVGVPHLTWHARRGPGPMSIAEAARLERLISYRRPHVVHLHASKAGLAGRLAVRHRIPTMFQPHGWSWLAVDRAMLSATLAWERAAARWTGLFVCVGEAEAEQGRARQVLGRYAIIRNGVDLHHFTRADHTARARARAWLGVHQGARLAVCVGRVTRQKGQDVLLAAWPAVRWQCPGAELAVVGDGDLRASLPAAPGVRFVGAVDDVRTWLAAADVVVLPSRWEGLSLTALEAMAVGRPVVASAISGLTEVVTAEVGALVQPERATPLADAIAHRLRDRALAESEGRAAARHAARFDSRRTYDHLAAETVRMACRGGTR